jgi:hypothetical protein
MHFPHKIAMKISHEATKPIVDPYDMKPLTMEQILQMHQLKNPFLLILNI